MKLIVVLLFFAFSSYAETLISAESYRTFTDDSSYQTNTVWAQKSLLGKVGVFGWGQYGTNYRQAYAGPSVQLTDWLQAGIAFGAEHADEKTRLRLGSFAYASKGRASLLAIYENLASGYWYLAVSDVKVNKYLSVGTHSQAFIGHGPRAQIKIGTVGNWVASLRPAATWDKKSGASPNIVIGLQFTYFKEGE